jgi:hypothetical protein
MSDPYLDLEEPIRELAHMASIARFLTSEFPAELPPVNTDRLAFAISKVAEMAEDLEKAYHAKLKENA